MDPVVQNNLWRRERAENSNANVLKAFDTLFSKRYYTTAEHS
jgi:hypothetical protein